MMKKYLFPILAALVLASCSVPDEGEGAENINPNLDFSSFVFEAANNPGLEFDYSCPVIDGTIEIHFPYADDSSSLVASFEGNFHKAFVDGREQVSGVTAQDFNREVKYELTDEQGRKRVITARITVASGLPLVHIDTGGKPVTTRSAYVKGTVRIGNTPSIGVCKGPAGIRGRGNATWLNYPKKPYRIKFDEKKSVFGFPANKDWVLLPDYCDKSLMRSSYMFAMSELAGLPYTIRSRHVEVILNGDYLGTYLLTDHVEEAKDRVRVSSDGFLIEADNYWYEEPLHFMTAREGINYTFKYPDADDGEIKKNDDNYKYITAFMRDFEDALYSAGFADPSTGYRKYIDEYSFARWYLVQEVTGNLEPNPYYVLRTRGAKLEMYPAWDAEWSLGLAARGDDFYGWALPPKKSPVELLIWNKKQYFGRLLKDPYFVTVVQSEWEEIKRGYPAFREEMARIAETLAYSQAKNFKRWPILNTYVGVGLVKFGNWEAEVEYIRDFLDARVAWLDGQIKGFTY